MTVIVLITREPVAAFNAALKAPWWAWSGGACGAVYVVAVIMLLPRLGTAAVLALFVTGQMLASLAIDHIGAFGAPRHPLDTTRIVGALMLVLGVILVRR